MRSDIKMNGEEIADVIGAKQISLPTGLIVGSRLEPELVLQTASGLVLWFEIQYNSARAIKQAVSLTDALDDQGYTGALLPAPLSIYDVGRRPLLFTARSDDIHIPSIKRLLQLHQRAIAFATLTYRSS